MNIALLVINGALLVINVALFVIQNSEVNNV
jgi:hypothetical protein